MSSKQLSFDTQFALHLTASLLGTKRDPQKKIYWRTTPLFSNDADADAAFVLFVDISWNNQDQSAMLGILQRRQQQQEQYYYTRCRLAQTAIEGHLSDLGIDVETTTPTVMAHCVAKALKSLKQMNIQQQQQEETMTTIRLPLYHQDMEETGTLTLEVDSNCPLNAETVEMILANLEQQTSLDETDADGYDEAKLERDFAKQQQQLATPKTTPAKKKRPSVKQEPSVSTTTATTATRRGGGHQIRRKKPKTLSYSSNKK